MTAHAHRNTDGRLSLRTLIDSTHLLAERVQGVLESIAIQRHRTDDMWSLKLDMYDDGCCASALKLRHASRRDREFLAAWPHISQQFEQFWRTQQESIEATMRALVRLIARAVLCTRDMRCV